MDELKNKRIVPFMQKEAQKRIEEFQKAVKLPKPVKKPTYKKKDLAAS